MNLPVLLLLPGLASAGQFAALAARAQETRDPKARVGLYTSALAAFVPGEDDVADKVAALVGRAYAYDDLKRYQEGLRDAGDAEKLQPDDWTAHKAEAFILDDLRRCDASSAAYKAALGLAPPEAKSGLYRELGLTLRDCAQDYAAAEGPFVKAIEAGAAAKDVDDLNGALRAFAVNACRQGKFEPALQALDRSLALIDDTGTLYDKAVCLDDAGRADEAKAAFSEVIRRAEAADLPAGGYAEAGRRDDGKTVTIVAADLNELPDSYFRRARLERGAGEHIAADQDFKEACRRGRKDACPKPKATRR